MKDIRIYDFEFNLLCIMTDVVSAQWHILYNDVGTFEGRFRLNDSISDIIMSNKYIVIVQGDLQAVCTGKIVENDLVVCGRTVNWILKKRVRPPFKSKEIFGEEFVDAETILLYCLEKGFIAPPKITDGVENLDEVDEKKVVSNFIIPQKTNPKPLSNHFWRLSANDLEKLSSDLCQKLERGHKVIFDIENKCWRFEFIYPKNNETVIAKEAKTAFDFSYSDDILDYSNGGWYAQYSGTGEEEVPWKYIENEDALGIYFWDCVLSSQGESEASDEIIKKSKTNTITTNFRNLKFGIDYNLGDVFLVYFKFGEFECSDYYMVTGVDIKYSPTQIFENPILKQSKKLSG